MALITLKGIPAWKIIMYLIVLGLNMFILVMTCIALVNDENEAVFEQENWKAFFSIIIIIMAIEIFFAGSLIFKNKVIDIKG